MSLLKDKKHGQHQKDKPNDMVPPECLIPENQRGENGEHHQRDHLLHHLELPQIERPVVPGKPDPVGWYLKAVLEQSNSPTQQDNGRQPPIGKPVHLFKLQMTIPGKRHKDV